MFTGVWSLASAGGIYSKLLVRDAWNKANNRPPQRNCENDGYGCLNGFCWTNCGPRLSSQDFCLITYNVPKNKSEEVVPINYSNNSDCTNCLPCGSACFMVDNAAATINEEDEDNNSKP